VADRTLTLLYALRDVERDPERKKLWHGVLRQMVGDNKTKHFPWWETYVMQLKAFWVFGNRDPEDRERARVRLLWQVDGALDCTDGRFVPRSPFNRVWENGSPDTNLPVIRETLRSFQAALRQKTFGQSTARHFLFKFWVIANAEK
jgi:hypothetical protein